MKLKFFFSYFILFYPCIIFANDDKLSGNESYITLFIFGAFVLFMYFSMIRPQFKREKVLKKLRDNLVKGDEVIILNGVLATIVSIKDQWVVVSISDNCEIIIQKSSIMQEIPKGTIKSKLNK